MSFPCIHTVDWKYEREINIQKNEIILILFTKRSKFIDYIDMTVLTKNSIVKLRWNINSFYLSLINDGIVALT